MKAILLAGGLGTRLRPLTNTIPKCLVSINHEPLLEFWLKNLENAGISNFLINTHYLPDQVKVFIEKSRFRSKVVTVHEDILLGTAGTLKANLDFFENQDGMLLHADNYCMANLDDFKKAHMNRPRNCLVTMMTFITNNPSGCGIVECDDSGVVVGFHEKVNTPPGNIANAAIYILSKEFIEQYENSFSNATDFSTEVLPNLMGKIFTHLTSEIFLDIGTPENYMLANKLSR